MGDQMTRFEYNELIMQLVKAYMEINPELRYTQALHNLGVFTDLYYEESEKTYLKVKGNFDMLVSNTDVKVNKVWRAN